MSRKNVEDIYPLSPLQEGMLFHALYSADAYVEQWPLLIEGALDVAAYHRALNDVVARHSALRTGFVWEGVPRPMQVVSRAAEVPADQLDWSGTAEAEWRGRLDEFLRQDRQRGFDLKSAPLIRLAFLRLAERRHVVVFTFHHILMDAWSAGLVLADWEAFYRATRSGSVPALPPAPRYRDYLGWLQRRDGAAAEAFWRASLAGFGAPTPLPFDRGGGDVAEEHAGEAVVLQADEAARLQAFARERALTLNTLVQGAWALVLARHAGAPDVAFGVTVSGRPADLPGVERAVGLFINTLPLRVAVPVRTAVGEWLADLQRRQAEMRQHEHVRLVDVQGWSEVPRDRPLFGSLLVFENAPAATVRDAGGADGLRVRPMPMLDRSNYPLTLVAVPRHGLELRLNYDARRFTPAGARLLLGQLAAALASFAEDASRPLAEVGLTTAHERERLVAAMNRTAAEYPRHSTIPALFAEQAARTPGAPALDFGGRVTTYRELDEASNRLAHHLQALGVGPEDRVAVAAERSAATMVALLAVVKAGAAYVPLDPSHPVPRLAFMTGDSGARALVAPGAAPDGLAGFGGAVVSTEADAAAIAARPATPPEGRLDAANLAYVVYTSGSTGTPKGTAVPHRGVLRLVRGASYMEFGAGERIAQLSNASFDVFTWELWGALLNGGCLVGITRDEILDPARLARAVQEKRVTAGFLSAGLFVQAAGAAPGAFAGMRTLLAGGDAVDPASARRILQAGGPAHLLNGYGPTECTTYALTHRIADVPPRAGNVPIGRPISNTTAYVVDAEMRPVAAGVPGELLLGGDGLARGYLNRPALTAERFVPDPFGPAGSRLYRTGDRARWNEHGEAEFLGRVDFQVKVRGFRVEPGEVEAALTALPAVAEAAVVARDDGQGATRLVAYVAGRGGPLPSAAELRHAVAAALPEYMVPSAFVRLDRLPLTPNGKVDRRALPEGGESEAAGAGYVPPATPTEEVVARIWAQVLGVERIGRGDSFFERGGHSLLATQVISRIRQELEVELPIRELFEAPRLAELAARLDAALDPSIDELLERLEGLSDEDVRALLAPS